MIFEKLNNGSHIKIFSPKSIYYNENFDKDNLKLYKDYLKNIANKKELFRSDLININTSHNTNYILNKDEFFKPLLNKILNESKLYLNKMGYDDNFCNKIYIESSWFNIGKKNDNLVKHIHPGSLLSGAYYIECDNINDKIFFFGDDDMTLPPKNFNELSSKFMSYSCLPGSLLLFKSNINHCTNKQNSNEKITVSFNINII
tara:strand:- start:205 stop:810 length:606 start_codon:yes stop_codon:yes gene_type:complete